MFGQKPVARDALWKGCAESSSLPEHNLTKEMVVCFKRIKMITVLTWNCMLGCLAALTQPLNNLQPLNILQQFGNCFCPGAVPSCFISLWHQTFFDCAIQHVFTIHFDVYRGGVLTRLLNMFFCGVAQACFLRHVGAEGVTRTRTTAGPLQIHALV